ncbi:MAG: energy-coupling factor transporter transmembrane component T [Bacillota bacterium]
MERFNAKNALYPILAIAASVVTVVFGLVNAKTDNIIYFYVALYALYLCFGYYKACIAIIPMLASMVFLFCGITYLVGADTQSIIYAMNRSFAVCFGTLAGLGMSSPKFIRSLRQIKVPKTITLGMMIAINFFPLFIKEMRQIRSAMKTRGAGSMLNIKVFYRAFLIPLVVRIVHISDTLSLSVETRGFTVDPSETTIFEPTMFKIRDGIFAVIFIVLMVGVFFI